MNMNLSAVKDQLTTMLEDQPRGTTADIAEHTAIYWDGKKLVGIHLILDHPGSTAGLSSTTTFLGYARESRPLA